MPLPHQPTSPPDGCGDLLLLAPNSQPPPPQLHQPCIITYPETHKPTTYFDPAAGLLLSGGVRFFYPMLVLHTIFTQPDDEQQADQDLPAL
jgi:hypothetical protein